MPVLLAGDTSLDPSFGTWTLNQHAQLTTQVGAWPESDDAPAVLLTSYYTDHGTASCSSTRPPHGSLVSIQFHAMQLSHNGLPLTLTATFGSNHTTTWTFPSQSDEDVWKLLSWVFIYDDTGETLPTLTFTLTFEQGVDGIVDALLVDYVVSFYNPGVVSLPTYDVPATAADEWTAQGLRGEHWYLCAKCQFPYPKSQTVVVTSNSGALVRRCKACVDAPRNDEALPEWNAKRTSVADGESRDSVKEIP